MASGTGQAIIDFGSFPGSNEASVQVTGQASISAGSKADAYFSGDDTTSDHSESDHRYADALIGLTCGQIVAGTGFTIFATSTHAMSGTFTVRWVWAD